MTSKQEFYNEEIKNKYLNTLNNEIIYHSTILLFRKSEPVERVLGKDIYEMTFEELGEVAHALENTTSNAVYNNVLKLEDYIKWSSVNKYRKGNLNPLQNIDKVEWSKQFVATRKNYYFTRKDVLHMMDELDNYPDKALLLALFEGIKGKGFSEILNLKMSDITKKGEKNWVHLYDDVGKERDLEISDELVSVLESADRQMEYYANNGDNRAIGKRVASPYAPSDKVFKKTTRGKQTDDELTFTFVNRKFIFYKDFFKLDFLKPKHVTDSGIMHYSNELQEEEAIDTDSINEVADRFDTPMNAYKGKRYRNVTTVKKVIEIPAFSTLYGYEMKFSTRKTKA